jgi:hypothetical protein
MSGGTWGEVELLRSLGGDLRGRAVSALGPVAAYHGAVMALNGAPATSEVAIHVASRGPALDALLAAIGVADERLVAYADALAWADANVPGLDSLDQESRRALLHRLTDLVLAEGSLDDSEAVFAALGEHAADRAEALLADEDATIEDWQDLAALLEAIGQDEAAAAAFFAALGPEGTAQLPQAIEEAWLRGDVTDRWPPDTTAAWDVMLTMSETLAVASHTVGQPGGLPASFFPDLLAQPERFEDRGRWPTDGEIGLLFAAGTFSDAALLPLAARAEQVLPTAFGPPVGPWSPWGIFADPATTWLPAIAASPMAAASQPRTLVQLVARGQLSEEALDVAMLEAARRSAADDAYAAAHAQEMVALGLLDEGRVPQYQAELEALGVAITGAGATHQTISALWDRASTAGRDLRTHPDPAVRSQAARTLQDTPPWLRGVVQNPAFRATGRVLPAAGIGVDVLRHLDAGRGPLETAVRTGTGAAGAAGGGTFAAKTGAPLLAGGPPGWVGYGLWVFTGATVGGRLGDGFGGMFFYEHPDAGLWFSDFGREPMPAPGPPELVAWP